MSGDPVLGRLSAGADGKVAGQDIRLYNVSYRSLDKISQLSCFEKCLLVEHGYYLVFSTFYLVRMPKMSRKTFSDGVQPALSDLRGARKLGRLNGNLHGLYDS